MRIKIDTNPDGFLRADSANARRFIGPKLGPAATVTMATLVELGDQLGAFTDIDLEHVAARVGLSTKGLEKALSRLEAFHIINRSEDELLVREWVDVPTTTWREKVYPPRLAADFKMLVDSVIAAGPVHESELDDPTQTALEIAQ